MGFFKHFGCLMRVFVLIIIFSIAYPYAVGGARYAKQKAASNKEKLNKIFKAIKK